MQGYLYTDSIENIPLPDETLTFCVDFRGDTVATITTDSVGFWSFRFTQPSYYSGYRQCQESKFQYSYPYMTIYWHDSILLQSYMQCVVFDTLYLYTK